MCWNWAFGSGSTRDCTFSFSASGPSQQGASPFQSSSFKKSVCLAAGSSNGGAEQNLAIFEPKKGFSRPAQNLLPKAPERHRVRPCCSLSAADRLLEEDRKGCKRAHHVESWRKVGGGKVCTLLPLSPRSATGPLFPPTFRWLLELLCLSSPWRGHALTCSLLFF